MPSRKRIKGKARKTKATIEPGSICRDNIQFKLLTQSGGCQHGCPPPSRGDVRGRFIDAFFNQWIMGSHACQALEAAIGRYPDALNDGENKEWVKDYFVAYGTEIMAGQYLRNDSEGGTCWRLAAGVLVLVILVIEYYDPSMDLADIREKKVDRDRNHLKNMDAYSGCERSLIKFYSRRISCSCLDEKLKELKSQPRRGSCEHCRQSRVAKSLMVCTGCSKVQYCSQECQVADWPSHEQCCKRESLEHHKL